MKIKTVDLYLYDILLCMIVHTAETSNGRASPATRNGSHRFVELLLKAGRAESAGLVGAAGDDGAVRHTCLSLAAGEVCIKCRPVLFSRFFILRCKI